MDLPDVTPLFPGPKSPAAGSPASRSIGGLGNSGTDKGRPGGGGGGGGAPGFGGGTRSIGPTPLGGAFPGDASAESGTDFWPEGDWVAGSAEGIRLEEAGGAIEPRTDARTPVESPAQEGPAEVATEWPVTDPPSRPTPRLDLIGAQRDVLLWQRWARYVGAGLMVVGALVLRARMPLSGTWELLAALAVAYGAVTALVAWFLGYASAETMPPKLSALVMSMDLAAAAGTVYLTAPARDYDRLLVLGLGLAQVAVVYYGLSCAVWGLVVTLVAYVGGSLLLPALVPGPPAVPLTVAADTATFSFAGAVLLYTFGSFRARMNALRRFCRDVEVGELGGTFDATTEPRPDDLTLLARSVDEMRQRLIELIGTDPLTGCFNRRALETRLARDCRYARRKGTPLAVLAVDVDHFKPINDSFGHPFGDYVLQTVAEILKDTARDTDAVARPGGDEFILVLPDTGWQGATAFAERLRRNVDDHIFGDELTSLQVTVSVGVAVARAVDNHPPEALLAEADRSLYRAKSAGRNRISA